MKKLRTFLLFGISAIIFSGNCKGSMEYAHAIALEDGNAFSPPLGANTTADESWKIGFAGHEWLVIGYNGNGVAPASNALTLLLSDGDKNKPCNSFFAQNNFSNEYDGSGLQSAVNAMLTNTQSKEYSLIMPRLLDGIAGSRPLSYYWPLSFAEITGHSETPGTVSPIDDRLHASILYYEGVCSGMPPSNGYWILRSPALLEDKIKIWAIASDGVSYTEASAQEPGDSTWSEGAYIPFGVRPCFHLNARRIFAISPAENGKTSALGILEEAEKIDPTQGSKFTIIDPYDSRANPNGLCAELVSNSVLMDSEARSLYFEYKNASIGEDAHISCFLREKNAGEILYYGKLVGCDNPAKQSGDIALAIPEELADGEYTLQVFSEEINSDFYTDFASEPFEILLTQKNGVLAATAPQTSGTNPANSNEANSQSANKPANKRPTSPATSDESPLALLFLLSALSLAIFHRICYSKKTSRA